MSQIIFFILFVILSIIIYVIIIFLRNFNFHNKIKYLENLENKFGQNISLHLIMLKENFNLKKLEEIVNLSNIYNKKIDIYIHSNHTFELKNNLYSNTYNHNYENGKIVKLIHENENIIENIKNKIQNMINRHKKNYNIVIMALEEDFKNLIDFLKRKNKYFGKKIQIL